MAANLPKKPDVIFVSYDEPNADQNYRRLLSLASRAKRVHGVKGIGNAYRAAARLSDTSHFFMVDGDNWVLESFKFVWPELAPKDIYLWPALNAVNGLVWYNGGIKFLNRNSINGMGKTSVDFFLTIPGSRKNMAEPASENRFNHSPYHAWKCAYRECAKLAGGLIEIPAKDELLRIWQSDGAKSLNGNWTMLGARMGHDFGKDHFRSEELTKINDARWMNEEYRRAQEQVQATTADPAPSVTTP